MTNNLLDEALRWRQYLVKAIEEKGGDYVYEAPIDWGDVPEDARWSECRYVAHANSYAKKVVYCVGTETVVSGTTVHDEGEIVGPSCLVGYAAYYGGVDLARLAEQEGIPAREALEGIGPNDEGIRSALDKAQSCQDRGSTWGEAFEEYDRYCSEHIPGYDEAVK